MEAGRRLICRVCFETVTNHVIHTINAWIKNMLALVLPDLDLGISENPIVCSECLNKIIEISYFLNRFTCNEEILKCVHPTPDCPQWIDKEICRTCCAPITNRSFEEVNGTNYASQIVFTCIPYLKETDFRICDKCLNYANKMYNIRKIYREISTNIQAYYIINTVERGKKIDLNKISYIPPSYKKFEMILKAKSKQLREEAKLEHSREKSMVSDNSYEYSNSERPEISTVTNPKQTDPSDKAVHEDNVCADKTLSEVNNVLLSSPHSVDMSEELWNELEEDFTKHSSHNSTSLSEKSYEVQDTSILSIDVSTEVSTPQDSANLSSDFFHSSTELSPIDNSTCSSTDLLLIQRPNETELLTVNDSTNDESINSIPVLSTNQGINLSIPVTEEPINLSTQPSVIIGYVNSPTKVSANTENSSSGNSTNGDYLLSAEIPATQNYINLITVQDHNRLHDVPTTHNYINLPLITATQEYVNLALKIPTTRNSNSVLNVAATQDYIVSSPKETAGQEYVNLPLKMSTTQNYSNSIVTTATTRDINSSIEMASIREYSNSFIESTSATNLPAVLKELQQFLEIPKENDDENVIIIQRSKRCNDEETPVSKKICVTYTPSLDDYFQEDLEALYSNSSDFFMQNYHLSNSIIFQLEEVLTPYLTKELILPIKQILIGIKMLMGGPNVYTELTKYLPAPIVNKIFTKFCTAVTTKLSKTNIIFPIEDKEAMKQINHAFKELTGLPNIIGSIGVFKFQTNNSADKPMHFSVQIACNANCLVTDCYVIQSNWFYYTIWDKCNLRKSVEKYAFRDGNYLKYKNNVQPFDYKTKPSGCRDPFLNCLYILTKKYRILSNMNWWYANSRLKVTHIIYSLIILHNISLRQRILYN